MNINSLLSSLSLESLDFLSCKNVNVVLTAEFGTIVADVKLDIDHDYYDISESEFFVDSVKVQLAEDDDGEPISLSYNTKELSDRIDILLHNLLERSFTSEDERNLILALT